MTGEGYERAESVLSWNRVTRLSAKAPFHGQPAARRQSWCQADATTQMSSANSERTFNTAKALAVMAPFPSGS